MREEGGLLHDITVAGSCVGEAALSCISDWRGDWSGSSCEPSRLNLNFDRHDVADPPLPLGGMLADGGPCRCLCEPKRRVMRS